MISLMQEDTRKAKEHGAENLTIGYFVMKVTLLKTAINYLGEIFSFLNMQTIFVRIRLFQVKYLSFWGLSQCLSVPIFVTTVS